MLILSYSIYRESTTVKYCKRLYASWIQVNETEFSWTWGGVWWKDKTCFQKSVRRVVLCHVLIWNNNELCDVYLFLFCYGLVSNESRSSPLEIWHVKFAEKELWQYWEYKPAAGGIQRSQRRVRGGAVVWDCFSWGPLVAVHGNEVCRNILNKWVLSTAKNESFSLTTIPRVMFSGPNLSTMR